MDSFGYTGTGTVKVDLVLRPNFDRATLTYDPNPPMNGVVIPLN